MLLSATCTGTKSSCISTKMKTAEQLTDCPLQKEQKNQKER